MTPYEYEKFKNDTIVFVGDEYITKALIFLLGFKGNERKFQKNVEYNFHLHAHDGFGFDTWIKLKTFLVINTLLLVLKMEKLFFL